MVFIAVPTSSASIDIFKVSLVTIVTSNLRSPGRGSLSGFKDLARRSAMLGDEIRTSNDKLTRLFFNVKPPSSMLSQLKSLLI